MLKAQAENALNETEPALADDAPNALGGKELQREANRKTINFKKRFILIPAVAALLIAAILVPTLIVTNRAPEPAEPAEPAQNGAAGLTPEDEHQNSPAARPTDRVEPTEPTEPTAAELAATADADGSDSMPVWKPTSSYQVCFSTFPWHVSGTNENYIVIKITGTTNEKKTRYIDDQQYKNTTIDGSYAQFTRVEYELLYCHGTTQGIIYKGWKSITVHLSDFLGDTVPPLYFPTAAIGRVKVGDTVVCGALLERLKSGMDYYNPQYTELYAKCVPYASSKWNTCFVLTDGKFDFNDLSRSGGEFKLPPAYDGALDYLQGIIDSGRRVVNKDLTARIPTARMMNGCTVEEFIEICEWYREFEAVAKKGYAGNTTLVVLSF